MRSPHTPLGALGRGLAAGVLATAAMTAYQEFVGKLHSGGEAESSQDEQQDPWESAPAPAVVAKRLIEGLFQRKVDPERIPLLTQTMHWGYGTLWGGLYGLIQETADAPAAAVGPAVGLTAWALSYAQLVPMGIYEPPWSYPASTLALDASYHLVYGSGLAVGYALLDR